AKVKKTASNFAIKAVKAVAKVITKQKSKQIKDFKPKTPVITHGEDMHLIPVQGEIHPARRDDAPLLEKQFRHNQQIAWQREQQLMRQMQSQTAAKKVFRTPRHS
ncbi:MAG TPA: hypothetical protein VK174_04765, partial [Chitinophagales bacterium]|nr:hypothetical protein [Chitinophagales bacterium]